MDSHRMLRNLVVTAMLVGLSLPAALAQAPHYGTNINEQRQRYLSARDALQLNRQQEYQALRAELDDYPLVQYLDYADLGRRLNRLPYADVDAFLERYAGSYLAELLEREWLALLADERRWEDIVRYYNPDNTYTSLTCYAHRAWLELGDDSQLAAAGELWNVARSQPNECDPVFEAWMAAGYLTPDIAWQRFSKNIQAGNRSLARYISTLMPDREQQLAQLYLQIDQQPERLRNLDSLSARTPEVREIILHGVRRLARIDAPLAMLLLNQHHEHQNFEDEIMLDLQRFIAMRLLVQGFDEETETLMRNTPGLATETLVSWLLRDALRDQDWPGLYRLLAYLPAEDRASERWQYWRARAIVMLNHDGAEAEAQGIYQSLAGNRSFYGYLAADRLGQPYDMTDIPVATSQAQRQALYDMPAIVRAHELFHIGDEINARNEWAHATARMSPEQIGASGRLALDWGWHRNTIQAMIQLQHWDDLELRFPLAYADHFNSAAAQLGLQPQFLSAITRQESAYMHDVRSPAGARGLMQLMPATAREVGRALGLQISSDDLYTPDVNISLGSHYLASLMEEFDNNRILAAAAYNAGPNRVKQWLRRTEDNPVPIDVWIETIPFLETRGYVQNVLVYAVIYGHRSGNPVPFMTPLERSALL